MGFTMKEVNAYVMVVENVDDLIGEVANFDVDLSGANGEEYTDERALEQGFNNTMEYFVAMAKKERRTIEGQLWLVINYVSDSYEDYGVPSVKRITGTNKFVVVLPYLEG